MRKLHLLFWSVSLLFVLSAMCQAQVFLMSTGSPSDTIDEDGNVKFLNLLSDTSVLESCDLTESQKNTLLEAITELSQSNQAVLNEMAEMMQAGVPNKEAKARSDRLMAANSKQLEKMLESTLTPDQIQQIEMLAFVRFAKAKNGSSLIGSKQVAKILDLSNDEQEALKKKADKIQERLEKDIAELKNRARQELIDQIPVEKRKIFKKFFVSQRRKEANTRQFNTREIVAER